MRSLFLALLLLLTPCLAAPEALEGFTHGTSVEEVLQRIGEPGTVEGPVYHEDTKRWVWRWDYANYGALFEMESSANEKPQQVRSVTIVAPSVWKLTSGLGLGDTTDKILLNYPNISRLQDSLWFAIEPGSRVVTGFELTGSRIKAIFVGQR